MLTHGLSDQGANGLPRLSPPYKGQLSWVWDGVLAQRLGSAGYALPHLSSWVEQTRRGRSGSDQGRLSMIADFRSWYVCIPGTISGAMVTRMNASTSSPGLSSSSNDLSLM